MPFEASPSVFLHYFTTVFDNIEDAVLLVGVEPKDTFRLLLCNEAFTRNSGHSKQDVGKTVKEVVSPKSYGKLIKRYKQAIKTKKKIQFVESYEVPIGRQTYAVTLLPILNVIGNCTQIVIITRNVTEIYELREKLKNRQTPLRN